MKKKRIETNFIKLDVNKFNILKNIVHKIAAPLKIPRTLLQILEEIT